MPIGLTFDLRDKDKARARALETEKQNRAAIAGEQRAANIEGNTALFSALGGDALAFGDIAQSAEQLLPLDTNEAVAGLNALIGQGASQTPTAEQARIAASEQAATQQRKLEHETFNAQLEGEKKQQGIDAQALVQRNLALTGGRTIESHLTDIRSIAEFGVGQQQVDDLRVMNRKLGRAALPGAAKGTYETKRTFLINMMGKLNDAGAMSAEEIKFYSGYIPDFGTFASLSFEQREASLRTLAEIMQAKVGILTSTTANAQAPQIQSRDISAIMGEPPAPGGTEPVLGEAALQAAGTVLEGSGLPQAAEAVIGGVKGATEAFQKLLRGE